MSDNTIHTPVLLERSLELLGPAISGENAVVVDATLGMGGHAAAILERFPSVTLVGIDRDTEALDIARERLSPYAKRVRLVHAVYDEIEGVLADLRFERVAGILFDLGVSSLQLDRVERGFSYSKDAPLDMRMDTTSARTAATILATYSELELRRIFYELGDEKLAPRFASRIVQRRLEHPITRSADLVELIIGATPAAAARSGHPAKRVFQALRIEVNQELAVLARAIPAALDSLEDRLVKREFQARAASTAPVGLPVELPHHRPEFRLLVRGAELASVEERSINPRSASVRLRAAERLREAA